MKTAAILTLLLTVPNCSTRIANPVPTYQNEILTHVVGCAFYLFIRAHRTC